MRGLLTILLVLAAAACSSPSGDADCPLPVPTTSQLRLGQPTQLDLVVRRHHGQQWIDVNGGIYSFPDHPRADGQPVRSVPPGEHVFAVSRSGKRLFAEDGSGRYELQRIGCG